MQLKKLRQVIKKEELDAILITKPENQRYLSGFTGGPKLLSEAASFTPPEKTLPRTPGHYPEWIAACKGGKPASCEFGFGALLTETALLGVIAVRTGKRLEWDAAAGRFTNDADANALIAPAYRSGWSL